MKKVLFALLVLFGSLERLTAATGSRSDDFLVVLSPLIFILLVASVYWIKAKVKAIRERKAAEAIEAAEHLHSEEP